MNAGIDIERTSTGVDVIVVTGEHDLATAGPLGEAIDTAIASSSAVVVDLDHAEFIDSAVLRVLIVGQQHADEAGKGFVIALSDSTGHAVRRLLELTGLDRKLTVAAGREAALAAVATAA